MQTMLKFIRVKELARTVLRFNILPAPGILIFPKFFTRLITVSFQFTYSWLMTYIISSYLKTHSLYEN